MPARPLRLALVEGYPQALAGQQETLSALLARARARGWDCTVLAPREGAFLDRLRGEGTAVEVHPQPGALGRYGGAVYRDGALGRIGVAARAAGYAAGLRRVFARLKPDAVFCNDLRGLLTFGAAARLARLPVVIWDKLDAPHRWPMDALQLPLATRNLVIADAVAEKYPPWQRRLLSGRIERVPNGIDLAAFSQAPAPAALGGLPDRAPLLLALGTVGPRKGHDVLLGAWPAIRAGCPEMHLAIAGETAEGQEGFADALRAQGHPGVHWLGRCADVRPLLARAQMLVSPSRREGMGRVNVEAMAMGLPVIGTAGTGIAEVVDPGRTGLLVPPGDAGALAAAVLTLANDPQLRARMGAAGRARAAERFDAGRQVGRVLDAIEEAAR